MKNIFQKSLIILFALLMGNAIALSSAFADENSLVVEFENNPLFSEANFLPGSEVARFAKVTNNNDGARDIIVEAINASDPDGLGDELQIGIWEGGARIYGTSTLSDFFSEGEVSLSSVSGGGGSAQYDFIVYFNENADNSYQEKSLDFDILIGFRGDEGGDNIPPPSPPPGGGGGWPVPEPIPGLSILNESATSTSITMTSAVISWTTSYKSTSRVVYDTASGTFNYSDPPNYGYASSTGEFDAPAFTMGVTNHEVFLTGLIPDTVYYYRSISHASPPTISREFSFTTPSDEPETENNGMSENNEAPDVIAKENIFSFSAPEENSADDARPPGKQKALTDEGGNNSETQISSNKKAVEIESDKNLLINSDQQANLIFGFITRPLGIAILIFIVLGIILGLFWKRKK